MQVAGRILERTVEIGGGHAGGSMLPLHFGLGAARAVATRVIWPDGTRTPWSTVAANQRIDVTR